VAGLCRSVAASADVARHKNSGLGVELREQCPAFGRFDENRACRAVMRGNGPDKLHYPRSDAYLAQQVVLMSNRSGVAELILTVTLWDFDELYIIAEDVSVRRH